MKLCLHGCTVAESLVVSPSCTGSMYGCEQWSKRIYFNGSVSLQWASSRFGQCLTSSAQQILPIILLKNKDRVQASCYAGLRVQRGYIWSRVVLHRAALAVDFHPGHAVNHIPYRE